MSASNDSPNNTGNQKEIAKAALLNEDGDLLILTRSPTDPTRPGRFDFAGGGIDPGESPLQAVCREVEEEIGVHLPPEKMQLMYSQTSWYDNISTIRFLFVGFLEKNTELRLSSEHSAYCWMPINKALTEYDHPVWIEGLKYLLEHDLL